MKIQIIIFWIAVTFYVAGTILMLIGTVFNKPRLTRISPLVASFGFILHTVGLLLRWWQTGHYPYWGRYEALNSLSWVVIASYFLGILWKKDFKITGTVFFPLAFCLTGIALTNSPEIKEVPESFSNYWLIVHIAFAELAFGAAIISAFYGGVYLLKTRAQEKGIENRISRWSLSLENADYYLYRFAVFAFITLGIMIASGAIWAHKAWGRYWGWDPIETWSLVCWFVYGILLHLRTTLGWKGKRAAWLAVLALGTVLFSYLGMSLIYATIHEYIAF